MNIKDISQLSTSFYVIDDLAHLESTYGVEIHRGRKKPFKLSSHIGFYIERFILFILLKFYQNSHFSF